MTPKTQAKELIESFKDKVNPYIGSGMLSDSHDDSAIMWQSKKCALICVDEILKQLNKTGSKDLSDLQYWVEVEYEIKKL